MRGRESEERLAELRERLDALKKGTVYSDDFLAWRKDAIRTVEEIFGAESTEVAAFLDIRFELPPGAYESFAGQYRTFAEQTEFAGDERDILDRSFHNGLHEASEYLLGSILALKK